MDDDDHHSAKSGASVALPRKKTDPPSGDQDAGSEKSGASKTKPPPPPQAQRKASREVKPTETWATSGAPERIRESKQLSTKPTKRRQSSKKSLEAASELQRRKESTPAPPPPPPPLSTPPPSPPAKPKMFDGDSDPDSRIARMFRVTNPEIQPFPKRVSGGSTLSKKTDPDPDSSAEGNYQAVPPKKHLPSLTSSPPPPPSSLEEEFYEEDSWPETSTFEDFEGDFTSREETFEEEEPEPPVISKGRKTILRETWDSISDEITRTFNNPTRVFKLRGYHSEPDLSLPFEEKFDPILTPPYIHLRPTTGESEGSEGYLQVALREKYVSCEDITQFSAKEHPSLVRGVLSEVKLRSYAIDDAMKNSWWELYDWERKRFSFFDELFAMGYVVDSLEVLSQPPRNAEGRPVSKGEYFVEAEEKHFRKKVDYGRVVFKTKHVYTGNFQDWYFEGPGRYCWQDGTIYQGEFSNGLMHGPGVIHWPDGCTYEGHFIYGKRTGWGVYSSSDGQNTYAGEWLNGLPHGHGKMWYDPEDDDNDYYEGQWLGGLPQGAGTRQYSTGDRYVGNWVEGQRHGYGIMIWLQERQVYKGEWMDGVPHGFGKHIWYLERSPTNSFPTRHVYQGNWTMGRREGVGKMVYPCGSIYEGRWKNGQRHGKGMFINPAGDILVGVFRAGSILGGSDVPLHAPTYECDYVGLIEWLVARFKLEVAPGEGGEEEEKLTKITRKYLPYLRKLYHRAGEYSQKYGKHGLYPAYLKKSYKPPTQNGGGGNSGTSMGHVHQPHQVHPRDYSKLSEPEHMRARLDKPESVDGVYPVTRFGLWLVLRDCDAVLEEVTMAYFDKIWCETPPLSFQTRHNPFEPVYLWQFLQALIVTSVAFLVDIPKIRDEERGEKGRTVMEPAAVSDTTIKSGPSQAEQKRKEMMRQSRAAAAEKKQEAMMEDDLHSMRSKTKGHRKRAKSIVGKGEKHHHGKDKKEATSTSKTVGGWRASQVEGSKGSEGTKRKTNEGLGGGDTTSGVDDLTSEEEGREFLGEGEEEEYRGRKSVLFQKLEEEMEEEVTAPGGFSISDCFESFLTGKLLPCLRREAGLNLPVMPHPLPALVDMYDAFKGIKQRDIIRGKEFFRSALPHLMFPNSKDALWWHRNPEPLSHSVDIDELMDMLREKFETVEGSEEKFGGEEMANFEENYESEYLGAQAKNSEITMRLLKLCRDNPLAPECPGAGMGMGEGDDMAFQKMAGNAPMMPVVSSKEALLDLHKKNEEDVQELLDLVDFTTEGHPFAEDELVPEPFLWADDYKCLPVRRKYQHFENVDTQDVFGVIHKLYPKLCTGKHEKNLQFELIFCDWLWATSLLAKTSTQRETREAWKLNPEVRPFTSPQSLGVYAHYVKQIKNNPYLSPNPPEGWKPKIKVKKALTPMEEEGEEDKKTVKFS